MSANKAKLNLDFGHGGVSMNFAKANDIQPRTGVEADWNVGTRIFNTVEFEDFPGAPQSRIDEARVKAIFDSISKNIVEWENENGCSFDNSIMEISISAHFFEVIAFPYSLKFSKLREITESDMKTIEECKLPEKMHSTPILGEKIKSFTSPYYTIMNENNTTIRLLDPSGKKTANLGFNAYFITKHPMLSKLLEMIEKEDKIKVSLSCEKEFRAFANADERRMKVALLHITDSLSEFSVWDNSELKYLNKRETGLKELKETLWRLCLCYHRNPELAEADFELVQNPDFIHKFFNMARSTEISDDSKDILSADDCADLLKYASCQLEYETEESFKSNRFAIPGKSKTKMTVSNYVFCYFVREAIRFILLEIKKIMYSDDFCKPQSVIFECSLPLKGIEMLASEVFEIPVRRAVAKWDGVPREDLPSSAVGALQSLISEDEYKHDAVEKKKTTKLQSLFGIFSSRA